MNKIPQISVLIANYNNGQYFRDAFRSLLAQTSQNWEAVIIDDASTDDSVGIIQELIADDPRFRFYRNDVNLGCQKTVERAISLSGADIFGRLDPDDALHPEALEQSLKVHQAHPEVGLVYTNLVSCDSSLRPSHLRKGRQVSSMEECSYNIETAIWHFATFKRHVFNRTAGLDPFNLRAEDQDYYLKMAELAPVKHIDRDLYFYRVHGGSASSLKNTERAFFWHWVALVKMSERRNINIEDLFTEYFVDSNKLHPFKQRRGNLIRAVKRNIFLALLVRLTGKKF